MNEKKIEDMQAALAAAEDKIAALEAKELERLKSGQADAGIPAAAQRPETPKEYKDRVLREMAG